MYKEIIMKLVILRIIMLIGMWGAWRLTGLHRIQWMYHYLTGRGSDMEVKVHLLEQVKSTLLEVVDEYDLCLGWDRFEEDGVEYVVNWHHFNHSTLYPGAGFYGRPELFYLVGGFTFQSLWIEDVCQSLYLKDEYDWHPNPEGWYFGSPLPIPWLIKALGWVFGEKYFNMHCMPSMQCGISNELWHDLEYVGAKPFLTKGFVSLKKEMTIP